MSNGFREYLRCAAAPADWRCWGDAPDLVARKQVRRRPASRRILAIDRAQVDRKPARNTRTIRALLNAETALLWPLDPDASAEWQAGGSER
jgi:hypothetical protein